MTIKEGVLFIRPTDKAFEDSSNTGSKACICSRCKAQIQANEMPIRITADILKGEIDEFTLEYRFCEECTTGKMFFNCDMGYKFGSPCDKQCDDCKNKPPEYFL